MRLGLDIGTNSIGWWLYATSDGAINKVVDGGVRIFSDGREPAPAFKVGKPLAVKRREARSARRRRDRYLRRKAALMKRMAKVGLMPADPDQAKQLETLDPYELRTNGLDQKLPLTHFGRALFHLSQRRGFKSNRKTDRGDNESGKIKDATKRLDEEMGIKKARTYGEFLHMRRAAAPDPKRVPSVRTRLSVARRDNAEKEESGYDFYPDRRHLEEEFDKIWAAQAAYHPELTDDLRDEIRLIIFYQRPLKTPEVGLCLFTDEKRIPSAHPLNQRRILLETVNALRIAARGESARGLTREERDNIVLFLDNRPHIKDLKKMTRTLEKLGQEIKLRPDQYFTLATANRDAIACDPVRASLSHPDRFGPNWSTLDVDAQWDVVKSIRAVQSEAEHDALIEWLMTTYALERNHAEATAHAPLPEGYGRLGLSATTRILAALKADVIPYSTAVAACGWHHSDGRTGEVLEALPYYGQILDRHVIPGTYDEKDDDVTRYGRITNPTVHIGLNQLRRLINRIVTVYGKPDEIVVELARDLKLSEDQKRDVQRDIKKFTEAAIARGEKLEEMGVANTGANRMRLRLWEALGDDVMIRNCPYSGQRISAGMVFDGSCDVDHILPYSRTLDDSFANRTLCLKEFNRQKTNKTPWEVWGNTAQWDTIAANLKHLPKDSKKAWRFAPDAMERFERENDFSARALKDTQYLSRIARAYLDALYDGGDGKSHVWVVPGRLTEMLRRHWGLNGIHALSDSDKHTVKTKNRTDHRHHAIDAAVVAATDRSLVQRISKMAGRDELAGAEQVARSVEPPWDDFRKDIAAQLATIIVSHRADHGRIDPAARKSGKDSTSGQLHNDTAYGLTQDGTVVSRKPLSSLKPNDIAILSRGANIRDPYLQRHLARVTRGLEGKDFEQALSEFANTQKLPDQSNNPYYRLRRVRLEETLQESARVEISDHTGKPFKAYKGDSNHCYEIWRLPDGKIKPQVVTTFEAHQPNFEKKPHPAAKRLLRVFKRDMVRLEKNGMTIIGYVQSMHVANGLYIAPHTEANADARNRDKTDSFKFIQMSAGPLIRAKARRVFVDEMGRLRDPGPRV